VALAALGAWQCGGGHEGTAATQSIARLWNEEALDAIRRDNPRPTVHARNLFHLSVAMWDAWAAYDPAARGYLVDEDVVSADPAGDRAIAISYAAYRVLRHRYNPDLAIGGAVSQAAFDDRMGLLGLDGSDTHQSGDDPVALGNRIAGAVIDHGLGDRSNETTNYRDLTYEPANEPLVVKMPGITMQDPNRWQPLALDIMIGQNGVPLPGKVQVHVGSHWGGVTPFALARSAPGAIYHDPGPPPQLGGEGDAEFKANIVEVLRLASRLTPDDPTTIDISPGAFGNNPLGTNEGTGTPVNPVTGEPYTPQVVLRGDFGRVLAEFWADGPESETPPGHWNTLANYVADHPLVEKHLGGTGPVLDDLEWDVKVYLALNGALHDAAIAAWDVKRAYDYVRPISMARYMAQLGQSSDPDGPSYHPQGLPLVPGLIEVVSGESAAPGERHAGIGCGVGELAIFTWPGEPPDRLTQHSGIRWVCGKSWSTFQRPTFVTPPFAAYVSGHSTFSRSAAEVLAGLTGSPYFPGGLGEFVARAHEFLQFEEGPSTDVRLQWATYYDAADQAGQSRLWGGIHVAADDFNGRRIGHDIGLDALAKALTYYD
jgi:hypothetical protein